MQYLKADTATKVTIGPVVAVGDGFTPVTTLSPSTADEAELLKHNTATTTSISGLTLTAITGADGYYALDLTATELDTEGRLTVIFNDDSLCLPVRADFMVVNANVFDSLFAAATTDYLQVDAVQVSSDATAADNLEAAYDGTGYDLGGIDVSELNAIVDDWINGGRLDTIIDGIDGRTNDIDGKADTIIVDTNELQTLWTTGGAARLELQDVPTTAEFQARTIAAAAYFDPAADTVANVTTVANVSGNVAGSVASVTGAVGSVTGNVGGNVVGSVASVTGAVGSVTGNVGGNVTGSVGSVLGGIDTSGGTITTLDALDTAQDAQHAQTQSDISGISAGTAPDLLQTTTIATLASQTSFTLTAGSADDDAYNGATIIVTDQSTSTQKAVGTISDYTGSTRTVTLSSDPGVFTMATGDSVSIIASTGSGVTVPVLMTAVPKNRTWKLKKTNTGLVGEDSLAIQVGEAKVLAVDFANDLATNGLLTGITSVAIKSGLSGGVTFDTANDGVAFTQYKCKMTGVTAGTYVINVVVTYDDSDGGGTAEADVTLIVVD